MLHLPLADSTFHMGGHRIRSLDLRDAPFEVAVILGSEILNLLKGKGLLILFLIIMSYWKTKVVPKIKKYFDKPAKKKGAAEACKSFEASKESTEKEFEEKQVELGPKVIEIYQSIDVDTKTLVKQPTDAGIKKHSQPVQKLLEELSKIGFPGSSQVSEAASKYGPALVSGPVTYILQKTSTFIIEEVETPPAEGDVKTETPLETKEGETSVTTVVEEQKIGDDVVVETIEKVEETPTDDGKTVVTVQQTETITVPEVPKA
eukprot:Gb_40344 [translate_table: standard]